MPFNTDDSNRSPAVSAVDAVVLAAKTAHAFVVDAFTQLVSCCAHLLTPSRNSETVSTTTSPSTSPSTSTSAPTIRRANATPTSANASASSSRAAMGASSSAAMNSHTRTSKRATTRPRTSATTTPTTNAPSSRPWCGGAVDERIPVPNVGRLTLPEYNERRNQILARTLQLTTVERHIEEHRARERVRMTEQHIREAAASHIEHEDPPMYACSCGLCPDDTAAYAFCAASTIRRTIRRFGNRATTSVASLAIRRQSQCSMMVRSAASALAHTRGC